jgi:NitT/TauT family transport system substrate-binding protein
MSATRPDLLRLNLGDPSEGRVYYLPHFLAHEAGHFAREGVQVQLQRSPGGGHSAMGGQIGPVVEGEADACVGGPMVTMKLQEQGHTGIVSFCALVRRNPWVIAGRLGESIDLAALSGATLIDAGNVATARYCLEDALAAAGLAGQVAIEAGTGDLEADIARVPAAPRTFIHHSLHALGPALAEGRLGLALAMAPVMPAVPWSAYIARADAIGARPALFAAFRRAIGSALEDLAARPAEAIADAVAVHYPDYPRAALALAIGRYRDIGCFAPDPLIAQAEMAAFAAIMLRAGWLARPPDIAALLDPEIAA